MNRQARRASLRAQAKAQVDDHAYPTTVFSGPWVPTDVSADIPGNTTHKSFKGTRHFSGFKSLNITPEGIKCEYLIHSTTGHGFTEGRYVLPLDWQGDTEVGKKMREFVDALTDEFRKFEKLG